MKRSRHPLARRVRELAKQLEAIAVEIDDLDRLARSTGKTVGRGHSRIEVHHEQIIALQEAVKAAGGYRPLARKLGNVSSQAIQGWVRCPADRVVEVEQATGISRQRLRPDLYL